MIVGDSDGAAGADSPAAPSPSPSPSPVPAQVAQVAEEASEFHTLAEGQLSPRHRRLAQLAAEGRSPGELQRDLGYSASRVSVLLRNPHIAAEIRRLQDRIFEETIQQRLKSFAEPALANVQMILTDKTNRVKVSEKAEMSKWVLEKLDGKAIQKVDVGENMLSVLLDRLDARKAIGPRDVTSSPSHPDIETQTALPSPAVAEADELTDWVESFCSNDPA